MKTASDHELLRWYAETRQEKAFAELVQRHIDFVYSVALRIVRDSHLAEDVSQAVFLALAKQASGLTEHHTLAGWLHRTTQNLAANAVRSEVRRRHREEKAADMLPQNDDSWHQVAPELDHALNELSEPDRDLILRRYFQRQSAGDISRALSTTEEAAQKRVHRAVERLRHLLLKRNISVGSAALASALTSSAIQAAPPGLAGSITSALLHEVGGHAVAAATTNIITMTTTQKTLMAISLAAVVGTGVYEAAQTARRQTEIASFHEQRQTLQKATEQARQDLLQASNQIANLQMDKARLQRDLSDLHRLRAEVTALRAAARTRAETPREAEQGTGTEAILRAWLDRTESLKNLQFLMPDKSIPELALLTEEDWLEMARQEIGPSHKHEFNLTEEAVARRAFSSVRLAAKKEFGFMMGRALATYAKENDGILPAHIMELLPHFEIPVDPAMLARYEVIRSGKFEEVPDVELPIIIERTPTDLEFDCRLIIGKHSLLWADRGDPNYWNQEISSDPAATASAHQRAHN